MSGKKHTHVPEGMDRRDFLKTVGAVAGAAMLGGPLAACDGNDNNLDLKPVRGDGSQATDYIDTVVILQMENRSFDHYFGALTLHENRSDVRGLTASMMNKTEDGLDIPLHWLKDDYIISPDPGHSHEAALRQFSNGTNEGFVRDWERLLTEQEYDEKIAWGMGYYKREQLPALYTLADNFALCDHWFCSVLGPTWPNRFYSHGASSAGVRVNMIPFKGKTVYSSLEAAGNTIGVYSHDMIYFALTVDELRKYKRQKLDAFFEDARTGSLPNVTIVEPSYVLNDDHPPQDIRLGQSMIASVYEALRTSPQWNRTLFLVFYDEHGGFYDHVVPPKVEGEALAADDFDQLGFRVPGLAIGPLVRRGEVFSEVIDHSSVPALLARIFGVDQVNERAALAGDLRGLLDIELTDNARRPAAPKIPEIVVPHDKIRFALQQPYGQPELLEFARTNFGHDVESYDDSLRSAERLFRQMDAMRVARIGD